MKSAATLALAVFVSAPALAHAGASAEVSLLEGKAEYLPKATTGMGDEGPKADAAWRPLKKGTKLAEGDGLRTADKTKVELKLADGSRLRVGSQSTITLDAAKLGRGEDRQVSVSLWVGSVWAKVARRAGGDASFEVETRNAVAGVRGTSFAVLAQADLSSVVKVYTGTVGVRKGGTGYASRSRKQIDGPTRVDKKQWEEIVATAMRQVKVTALGDLAPAEDFTDAGDELEWAMWNQARDEKIQ